MKFTLVAAIRYLSDYELGPDEVLTLDPWSQEGYDLLIQLRDLMEGALIWTDNPSNGGLLKLDYLGSVENHQFRCLLAEVARQNLCLQFVGTYPCIDGDDNLQVFITPRKIAHDVLDTAKRHTSPDFPRMAIARPLQGPNSAGSKPRPNDKITGKAAGPQNGSR